LEPIELTNKRTVVSAENQPTAIGRDCRVGVTDKRVLRMSQLPFLG
jgi:hypothetical protein